MKLPKSRVIVLGCGTGNDAALFAQAGHVVTAVDFTDEAIALGKAKYGNLQNISWVKSDIFKLPQEFDGQFDIVFEHTCFCAINPQRRADLVKTWRRLLLPSGFLMGVFFVMEKKTSAPFGGTEWEYKQRLKNNFRIMEWRRWHHSIKGRNGKELYILAQKK